MDPPLAERQDAGAADPGLGPLAGLLGIRRERMDGGQATFTVDVGPAHLNPYDVVHGGVIYTLADYAMGGAFHSRLLPGERVRIEGETTHVEYRTPVGSVTARLSFTEEMRASGASIAWVDEPGSRRPRTTPCGAHLPEQRDHARLGQRPRVSGAAG
jgi:uncharacterized protein (TIGR00369 family)